MVLRGREPSLPAGTGTLSDGSTVRLLQLTTGPYHDYVAGDEAGLWERLACQLPRNVRRKIFGDLPVREYSGTPIPDGLGIWIIRDSSVALNSHLQFRVSDTEGNYATSTGYRTFNRPTDSFIATVMKSFPRRADRLVIELQERGGNTNPWATIVSWEVANPQRSATRSPATLVTNQLFHGYEISVNHVRMGVGTNRNGTVGSTGSFEFAVTQDGRPRGDWLLKDFGVQDGLGSWLLHPEQGIVNGNGTHRWTTWGDYRTRETPFALKVFLEPHPLGSTNLINEMQSLWTVTNLVNRSRSFTNYPGRHEAFGHVLSLEGFPDVTELDPQLKLLSDGDLQSLEITLVSITDQLGQDMKAPQQGYRVSGEDQYFPLIIHTNSTSFVANILIKSLAEVHFVVEPEFDPPEL